jgi:hypothetical protein
MNNNLKRKAIDNICEKPSIIINSELLKHDIDTIKFYFKYLLIL